MDIGVGLPMKALEADELAEFAHTIESGPFASLSLGDRLAYECHDVLTTITYVAAITSRLRLSTSVLCLPLYREGVVAKQVASIDRLSKGRLSLGLGLGGSRDRLRGVARSVGEDTPLASRNSWRRCSASGAASQPFLVPIRSAPCHSPLADPVIIGGFVPAALRRAGRMAHGLRSFAFPADTAVHLERYTMSEDGVGRSRPARPSSSDRSLPICRSALGRTTPS